MDEVVEDEVVEPLGPVDEIEGAEGADVEVEAPPAKDKRRHVRYRVSQKVFIKLSNGEIAQAQAVDLSMGGIYIEYGASADAGMEFDMAFDLPFQTDFKRVFVRAKIVRSIVIGSRNLFGLAFVFTEFAKDSERVLEKYLELRALQTS